MNKVYYNDNDRFAAAWLCELVGQGLLPDGDVDDRTIIDVRSDDLISYRQCHFFAGIGGWPHALDLAGCPRDREVWTASLPCQPLSGAGQQRGHADERHLWPAFYAFVAERRPATIFGEQVASALGREWFSGVRADLEGAGYACGAAIMPACAVGAPHRRERLFWVAVADAGRAGCGAFAEAIEAQRSAPDAIERSGDEGFWSGAEWRVGADGKARRVGAGFRLLVDGVPNRVGALRGFGNAIVPQVAAEFVKAVMDT